MAITCLVAGGAIAVSVAGGGSDQSAIGNDAQANRGDSSRGPNSERPGIPRGNSESGNPQGPPFPPIKGGLEPARMLSGYDCTGLGPPQAFLPVKNGWRAGDPRRETIVCAGGGGEDHRSIGRFLILRSNDVQVRQQLDQVDVPGAGPLTITRAPLGRSVARSAQQNGALEFKGENGATGILHLADDTITLNP